MTPRWLTFIGWGLAGLAGCDATCSHEEEPLPITGGTPDQRAVLGDVWRAFAQAWAPASVCISGVRVGGALAADAGGRYRRPESADGARPRPKKTPASLG